MALGVSVKHMNWFVYPAEGTKGAKDVAQETAREMGRMLTGASKVVYLIDRRNVIEMVVLYLNL